MVFKSFTELNEHYKTPREEMGFEEEFEFVQDCFDTCEAIGFKDAFGSPYDDKDGNNGKGFSVIRRLSYSEGEADLECLPMWLIRLEDGNEIEAFPEEICLDEMREAS